VSLSYITLHDVASMQVSSTLNHGRHSFSGGGCRDGRGGNDCCDGGGGGAPTVDKMSAGGYLDRRGGNGGEKPAIDKVSITLVVVGHTDRLRQAGAATGPILTSTRAFFVAKTTQTTQTTQHISQKLLMLS